MLLERFLWAKADEVAHLRQQERKGDLPVPSAGNAATLPRPCNGGRQACR